MSTRISRSAAIFLGLITCFPVASTASSVIFSDFGPGHTYNSVTGLAIAGTGSNPGFVEWGNSFTSSAKFDLTEIRMALGWIAGANGVTVSLDANNGGTPGQALATWSFAGLPVAGTSNSIIQTKTFAAGIVLQPGQTYWLVTAPLAANTQAVWNFNSIGMTSVGAVKFGDGWLTTRISTGAFEVIGTSVVPESDTWFLFGTGLVGILGLIRKRKQAAGTK